MCCRRKQEQRLIQAGLPLQPQRLSGCAARRQQRLAFKALALNSSPAIETSPHWTEYQPRTMDGIFVMGIALGLQEGGRKLKERKDEKKARKVLAAEVHGSAESSASGATRGHLERRESRPERKSDEARREQRRSFSSEKALDEDAPPSYDEVARPTYEEAVRENQRRH